MDHPTLVRLLVKPGAVIAAEMTDHTAHLMHMAFGIFGEAGELADAVKKHIIYGRTLDLENVKEELGDLEFYLEGFRQKLGISRREILEGNIVKLKKRYGEHVQYSDAAAIARADKAEPQEQRPEPFPEPKRETITIYDAKPCDGKHLALPPCNSTMVRIHKNHAYCANCGRKRPEYLPKT